MLGQIFPLPLGQVIYCDNMVMLCKESLNKVRADEASPAGYQASHLNILDIKNDPRPNTPIQKAAPGSRISGFDGTAQIKSQNARVPIARNT